MIGFVSDGTTTVLRLEEQVSVLSLAEENEPAILQVVGEPATLLQVVERQVGTLVLPAGQGVAGPPGRDGATSDLTFTAAVALSGHKAVCIAANGALAYASADDSDSAATFVGVTLGAAAPGAEIAVRVGGAVIEPSWSWSPGPVYVGFAGALTQVDPASGYALAVGVATAPDTLLVAPRPPFFIA